MFPGHTGYVDSGATVQMIMDDSVLSMLTTPRSGLIGTTSLEAVKVKSKRRF